MSYMFINTLYIYIYAYEKIFLRFKIIKKKKLALEVFERDIVLFTFHENEKLKRNFNGRITDEEIWSYIYMRNNEFVQTRTH